MKLIISTLCIGLISFNGLSQNVEFKSSNFKTNKDGFKKAEDAIDKGDEYFELANAAFFEVKPLGLNYDLAATQYAVAQKFNPNNAELNLKIGIYYGMGAYRFNIINNDWQLEPSFLIRKMHFQSSMTDLTTRILYLENTWGGLTYRTNGTAILSMGFGTENMNISYSYDHTFAGEIMPYTYGTHELGISFRINNGYR